MYGYTRLSALIYNEQINFVGRGRMRNNIMKEVAISKIINDTV